LILFEIVDLKNSSISKNKINEKTEVILNEECGGGPTYIILYIFDLDFDHSIYLK